MEQRDKLIESETEDESNLETLRFKDLDLLCENFSSYDSKHSLNDYFSSIGSFLKFLSDDIEYLTSLIDNLLMHLKNNKNSNNIDILLNTVDNENKTIGKISISRSEKFNSLIVTLPKTTKDGFNHLFKERLI